MIAKLLLISELEIGGMTVQLFCAIESRHLSPFRLRTNIWRNCEASNKRRLRGE